MRLMDLLIWAALVALPTALVDFAIEWLVS